MLATENKFIGRDSNRSQMEADERTKFAGSIIEPFRKFIVLARLTSNPNLNKVWPQFSRAFQR
jgi:hypothetical protein